MWTFQPRRTSSCLLVSDKAAIFPFIYSPASIWAQQLSTCAHTRRCTVFSTHASYCFLVVNNVPAAMLRLLTHSQPINQTIQRAYDHNKYARDECPAINEMRLKWLPEAESKKDKLFCKKQVRWWGPGASRRSQTLALIIRIHSVWCCLTVSASAC